MPALIKSQKVNGMEELTTPKEVAAYLGVSKQRLYSWRQSRTNLDFYRIGKRIFYRVQDVQEFKAERDGGGED